MRRNARLFGLLGGAARGAPFAVRSPVGAGVLDRAKRRSMPEAELTTEVPTLHLCCMALTDDLQAVRTELLTVLGRVERLIDVCSEEGDAPTRRDLTSIQYRTEAIERVLEESGEDMSPVEVWKVLTAAGRDDPKDEVQVTTNDLWHRGRIDRVARGRYKALPRPGQ